MITVIIPLYNEEEILESSVKTLQNYFESHGGDFELILASNGSTDKTSLIGRALSEKYKWLKFIELPNKGVGLAFREGVKIAGGEYIISLDIDLPTDLAFIKYSCELLKHADIVVGSKVMGDQKRNLIRIIGSQIYILIAQIFFRLTISDYAPSTKAFKRSTILKLVDYLDTWTGYVFELCLYAKLNNKHVVQVGVDCSDFRRSRFNLIHEGFYRYRHLFRCWKLVRDKNSWIHLH